MKYQTIGAFKNVQNVPDCKAEEDVRVGMGVILDRSAKVAKAPANEDDAKACTYIVTNINDKPEMHNYGDAALVRKGEYVRADDLTTVAGLPAEFAQEEISTEYSEIVAGDNLVFGAGGLLEKATSTEGYRVYFEVLEKTAYLGAGVLALIHVQ
jgi:hypothetical protein